ncbi:MAG: CpsD/CapB family tyrosine-protein kinase [Coriobacteriia bacterium]|nr:CpsD/CapB family tyrosine-protein kinase [Coriobacteriia bacterium]
MALFKSKRKKDLRPSIAISRSDAFQNAAATLMANIRFCSVDKPIKTIVITSSAPNEGKTTVAVALALAMVRAGKKVLMVEGDMRRRCLQGMLDVRTPHGVHAVLSHECTAEEAIVATNDEGLFFLNAEGGIPNPEAIIDSQSFADLLKDLGEAYDYVIIDTPPVAAFSDAAVIASRVDGTILVAREGYTERAEAAYATDQLKASGANILGVAMNGKSAQAGSYGYYYDYYYEDKTVPANSPEAKAALQKDQA